MGIKKRSNGKYLLWWKYNTRRGPVQKHIKRVQEVQNASI